MNEQPKSALQKAWNEPRRFFGWLTFFSMAGIAIGCAAFVRTDSLRTLPHWLGKPVFLFTAIMLAGFALGFVCMVLAWIPPVRRLLAWLLQRRFYVMACLVTLVALFYAEENWRGWHAWNQFKKEWETKGERFDRQSVVPPPVPDDRNFAFSPVWIAEVKYTFLNSPERAEAWYGRRIYDPEVDKIVAQLPVDLSGLVGTNWGQIYRLLPRQPDNSDASNWEKAQMRDLIPWQAYYRNLQQSNSLAAIPIAPTPQTPAQDVLLALSKFDPVIEKLRQDSALPGSRFPLQYDSEQPGVILLPHLAVAKRYAQVLPLRAIAELKNNQSEKALADVKLLLRLADSMRSEPILIPHLVRIVIFRVALQPVYEGLAEHRWSDAQLAELDAALAKEDFITDYLVAMRGEMVLLQIGDIEYCRRHRDGMWDLYTEDSSSVENMRLFTERAIAYLSPSGWFYQNELRCVRQMVTHYLPAADVPTKTISPAKVKAADAALNAEINPLSPYNVLERTLMPALGNAAIKFAHAQASTDLARTAIALERYRLAHGDYPESLDALSPQFIAQVPHDVIGGKPLKYRREVDGSFVLYSVGWNETDDGGTVVLSSSGKSVNLKEGDWVWRYPQK